MRIVCLVVAGVNKGPSEVMICTHRKVVNDFTVREIRWDFLKLGLEVPGAEKRVTPKGIHFGALNDQRGYLLRGLKAKGRRRERGT